MTNWAFWNRRKTLLSALDDWKTRGLINNSVFTTLHSDVSANANRRSFTSVIIMLGVICLAFGVMTFVAANWDFMSTKARVGLIFTAFWVSWGIAIICKMRSFEWAAQFFVLLACAVFGAAIMLISQIYHIQGEPKDAVWLWAIGTGIGAFATRSVPALVLYVGLITLWSVMDFDLFGRNNLIDYSYLVYWAAGAIAAWYLASRFAAHILSGALVFWLIYAVGETLQWGSGVQNLLALFIVLFCAYVGISFTLYSLGKGHFLKGFERNALVYLFILLAGLMLIWYGATDMRWDGSWRIVSAVYLPGIIGMIFCGLIAAYSRIKHHNHQYDMIVTAVFSLLATMLAGSATRVPFLMEAFMLVTSIWVIRMGWRLEYRPLSTLGFVGFAGVMLLFYFETLGSLLDTSLFYLGAGIILLAGAMIIPRVIGRRKKESAS